MIALTILVMLSMDPTALSSSLETSSKTQPEITTVLATTATTATTLQIPSSTFTPGSSPPPSSLETASKSATTTNSLNITTTTVNEQKQSSTLATRSPPSPNNRSCLHNGTHTGWLCDDLTTCIWLPNVCDGISPNCPDGSDEEAGCRKDPRYCPVEDSVPRWRCDDGECIYKSGVCDNNTDCQDGSDEKAACASMDLFPCPTNNNTLAEKWTANYDCGQLRNSEAWWQCLSSNNWRCDNGQCTKKWWVCDGRPGDCSDGSDEWEGCKSKYMDRFPTNINNRSCLNKYGNPGWLCDDLKTCTWLGFVCDGFTPYDCPDGSDEAAGCTEDPRYCPFEVGRQGWKCDDGECIYKENVCDSKQTCQDNSDERAGCNELDLVPCPDNPGTLTERWTAYYDCRFCRDNENNWRCDNGHCVKRTNVCDGSPTCVDGSDEWDGCELATCSNDSSITTAAMYKDGDCRSCWNEHMWRCNDGKCIFNSFLCDGIKDCKDWEDETMWCGSLVPCIVDGVTVMTEAKYKQSGECRSCSHKEYWRCNSGQCINKRSLCDNAMFGRWDCKDGSDEAPGSGCPSTICQADNSIVTTPNFSNKTRSHCLSCPREEKAEISKNYKRCHNGQCIKKILFCNGFGDCSDNSDEVGCSVFTYFKSYHTILLSCALVAVTALIYIALDNYLNLENLRSVSTRFPRKTPKLYKHIKKYCNLLDDNPDDDTNLLQFKYLHSSIRKRRNGLRELITTVTSLYREPQQCHINCKKILKIENTFQETTNDNDTAALQYIRLVAGSTEYTENFVNALETPGIVSKLSFTGSAALNSFGTKARYFMRVAKPLSKMVLFYLDVIKDVILCIKLLTIIGELEEVHILHKILVYISCVLIFLAQAVIGIYLVATMGKPVICMAYKKIPPPLFGVTLLLLFFISPLYPVILVVKDSILNCDIEEAKYELKSKNNKGLTKFLTLVSYTNKEAKKTKQQYSFYKITDSALEALPQLIIYGIFCFTYYYSNSLFNIFLTNTSTSNIILFVSSIPLSLYSRCCQRHRHLFFSKWKTAL